MLRCDECGRPVLVLSDAQRRMVEADPERYAYLCGRCAGEPEWPCADDDGDG